MADFISLDSIVIAPNRQRRNFDLNDLQELAASLGESGHGLLHPIVLRQVDGKPTLVAGERRFRATKLRADLGQSIRFQGAEVPVGKIPFTDIGALDPIDAFEAELSENIHRVDLTIVEKAQATAELMERTNGKPDDYVMVK